MAVVSNSSPLIALAAVGHLTLLRRLFGRVLIPAAVYREVVDEGRGKVGSETIAAAEWIVRRSVRRRALVRELRAEGHIGEGEAEAITLAPQVKADWLLLDDSAARAVGRSRGLSVVGTIGLLIAFHGQGWIQDVVGEIERLHAGGFRLSRRLMTEIQARYGRR